MNLFTSPIQDFLALLYPQQCAACKIPLDDDSLVCSECIAGLEQTGLGEWHNKVRLGSGLDGAWSIFWFDETLESLIHQFKYEGRRSMGGVLAEAAVRISGYARIPDAFDLLIPIPLHKTRQRERGYNQSELLAAALGELWACPVASDRVRRGRWTISQTGLSVPERQANTAGSFEVLALGHGECVLLIDDVLTTGATAVACASALKESGYGSVGVFSIATPSLDK